MFSVAARGAKSIRVADYSLPDKAAAPVKQRAQVYDALLSGVRAAGILRFPLK